MEPCDCSVKGQEFPWSVRICFKVSKMTHPCILNDTFQNLRVSLCIILMQETLTCFVRMCFSKLMMRSLYHVFYQPNINYH